MRKRMKELLAELERDEDQGPASRGEASLRLRSALRVEAAVRGAITDLAAARGDEEKARLIAYEKRSDRPTEAAALSSRLVALRRQVTWNKAIEAAKLVCLLLSEAMGGEPVSSDEAGITATDDERELVSWLVEEGRRVRAGSGGKNGFMKL